MLLRKWMWNLLLVLLLGLQGIPKCSALSESEKEQGFVSLFNGVDLTGWHVDWDDGQLPSLFSVEDGSIYCHGTGKGNLSTNEIYENYILRLKYKISENGNSGIYIHDYPFGRDSRVGGEVQIRDTHGQTPSDSTTGALYDISAPRLSTEKPAGEWNELEIHIEWPHLKVSVNGTRMHEFDLSTHERTRWRTRFGSIGLQDHQCEIWFRDIRIKNLGTPDSDRWEDLITPSFLNQWEQGINTSAYVRNDIMTLQHGRLIMQKPYESFQLWTSIKADSDAKGAFHLRWHPDQPGHSVTIHNARNAEGKNYTGAIDGQAPQAKLLMSTKDFTPMTIIADENEIAVYCNGLPTARLQNPKTQEGYLVLECETGPIHFRDLRIKSLRD